MEIDRYLLELSQKDPILRREALGRILETEKLPHTLQEQEPGPKLPEGVCNYLLKIGDQKKPCLLFCAHYDAYPGSFGSNDNAAAVCILIALAKELEYRNHTQKQVSPGTPPITAEFAFFDGEERGNSGSKLYVRDLDRLSITGVVNLDICGYGDTIAVNGRGYEKKASVKTFCNKKFLEKHRGRLLKYLPPGDDASFTGTRIPCISVAIVPRWDIQYLKALETYGDGFLGRPPEFDMMHGEMEVMNTMHGGFCDSPEWVEPDAMKQVYEYLLDAVTSPPVSAGRFGFF